MKITKTIEVQLTIEIEVNEDVSESDIEENVLFDIGARSSCRNLDDKIDIIDIRDHNFTTH